MATAELPDFAGILSAALSQHHLSGFEIAPLEFHQPPLALFVVRPFRYDLNQIPYNYTIDVTNRFKGLDLIDRVPKELWMEICDIEQEVGVKTIPKKKKWKKAKWLSEEALQIAVNRREAKRMGEKERYTHLNA